MKTKTINSVLCKRFDNFLASISDESVRSIARENTIITGGCIVSMLLNENVNDFDMYFRTHDAALAVAKYYAEKFKTLNQGWEVEAVSNNGRVTISVSKSKNASLAGEIPDGDQEPGVQESLENLADADDVKAPKLDEAGEAQEEGSKKEGERYRPIFLSSNAITLSTKVQLIIRFYGEPDEIHENYDFVHCTSYWTSWERKLTLRAQAMEAILTRELRYVGSKYPICSVIRTRKFLTKGWTINAGQYVKMAWQISELDLTDIEVLKEQLVGVDSAYFSMLIAELKKKASENPEDTPRVDGTYLITVIDKLFQ